MENHVFETQELEAKNLVCLINIHRWIKNIKTLSNYDITCKISSGVFESRTLICHF